jgi:hypothetical protein
VPRTVRACPYALVFSTVGNRAAAGASPWPAASCTPPLQPIMV